MHLKELEVRGFKSFLNKTKFKFQSGVSAIVGPNGCGKSNVVDAIKWVLGEQSTKSMRSSVMSEVIFNGTQKHDPVNVAEASLTLSNEDRLLPVDYDEVIIGRRLYRSGESEYLLNKVPVRLTDIKQLIMGTGIGTTSYSVVEQGKMDMLISSKPESRRYVFEEASGITRYKSKKHQAQLKLERTRENLTRINDIISEVERQIRSMERRARKAERYKKLFGELKELEISYASKRYHELNSQEGDLGFTENDLNLTTSKLKDELKEAYALSQKLKTKLREAVDRVHVLQQKKSHLESEISKNTDFIEFHSERVKELRGEVERLSSEIERDLKEIEELERRVDGSQKSLNEISEKRKGREEVLKRMQEKVDMANSGMQKAKHELKMNREKQFDLTSRKSQLENLMVKIDTDKRNCSQRLNRLMADKKDIDEKRAQLRELLNSVEKQFNDVDSELDALTKSHFETKKGCEKVTSELDELNGKKGCQEKDLNEIRPRREFLQNLIDSREGIKKPVKKVMELAENGEKEFSGVLGILSELISVESAYSESLEAVLGDHAQAIVVDTTETAVKICDFLEKSRSGSVSFLIISELNRCASNEFNGNRKGTLDDLTQIFSAKEPYSSALRAYLSNVFITVSSETAEYFVEKDDSFDGRIICEEGEIFEKGARRSKNFSQEEDVSILGRQEKVNDLVSREEELVKGIEDVSLKISEKELWLKDSLAKKEELEQNIRQVEKRHSEVTSKKRSLKENIASIEKEFDVLKVEISEMSESIKDLEEKKIKNKKEIEKLQEETHGLNNALENVQEEMRKLDDQREKQVFELADIRAQFSSLKKEEENLSYNLDRDRKSFDRAQESITNKRTHISENNARIDELTNKISHLRQKIEEQNNILSDKTGELEENVQKRDELDIEFGRVEKDLKDKEIKLQEAQETTHNVDMRKKELEFKKQSIVENIRNNYRTDITSSNFKAEEGLNWEEVAERIDNLKGRIERMGSVSPDAAEEQMEYKKRYEFLTSQRDDLVESKNSILKAIREINSTTKELFMETFEQIGEEFNKYFRMLFNGGKAELVLQDDEDVLEAGIDIIVRLRGKELHNVMQLSGGEKAMTAIALVFAIFKVNPSPFCILDEIDAPLDETNISRFTKVLQEFLQLSQFIIITHNRLTIQLADILYGVTMQEKGVSKVVSVKFKESEKASEAEDTHAAV